MASVAKQQPSSTNPVAAPTGKIKDFDNLRNILRGARNENGSQFYELILKCFIYNAFFYGSVDLYQHLVEIMNHIVIHCPDKGLDQFEEISYLLKHKDEIDMQEFLKISEKYDYNIQSRYFSQVTEEYGQHAKKFFENKQQQENPDDGEEVAPVDLAPTGQVPDLLNDVKIFQYGGVGFGDNETLLLQKSLKQHSIATGADSIRLWGKIHGTEKDQSKLDLNKEILQYFEFTTSLRDWDLSLKKVEKQWNHLLILKQEVQELTNTNIGLAIHLLENGSYFQTYCQRTSRQPEVSKLTFQGTQIDQFTLIHTSLVSRSTT